MLEDKWLEFIEKKSKPKTKVYSVISKFSKDELGEVKWYPQWRHYCFFPNFVFDAIYSDRCLLTISEFITKLSNEHKK